MGRFTTNLTQYLPLCNPVKYEHIYDRATGFITVKNIKEDSMFDYPELCEYLSRVLIINIIFSIKDIGSYSKVWGLLANYTIWKV